ncbi:MAG: hypothetical protein GF315_06825 [candidate division Zixibacteria bacterium]|nr:hypothetical protein [candidate division Zixibacteria bacterium]
MNRDNRKEYCDKMLHAYELGILSDEERQRFESHYLECDYCYEGVKEFESVARLLREDKTVYETAKSITTETETTSGFTGVLSKLWDGTRKQATFAPLAAAAMIVLLMIPAYLIFIGGQQGQVIDLWGSRSADDTVFNIDPGEDVTLEFRYGDFTPGKEYIIEVIPYLRESVYTDSNFTAFNSHFVGQLTLSPDIFEDGFYKLLLSSVKGDPLMEVVFEVDKIESQE